jgi:hypothetical protein
MLFFHFCECMGRRKEIWITPTHTYLICNVVTDMSRNKGWVMATYSGMPQGL